MRGALSLRDLYYPHMEPTQVHQLREPLHFSRKLDGPGGEFVSLSWVRALLYVQTCSLRFRTTKAREACPCEAKSVARGVQDVIKKNSVLLRTRVSVINFV